MNAPFLKPGLVPLLLWLAPLLHSPALSLGLPATVEWQMEEGYRWRELPSVTSTTAGFTRLGAKETGIHFTNLVQELSGAANRTLLNGSGVAAGDFDGDGWVDLYFCGLDRPNALYRNLGNWRFEDVTQQAGVACAQQYSRGAVFVDINADGHLDLLVTTVGQGVLCFVNQGNGTFREQTEAAGLRSRSGSSTLTLADVNGNGHLDLYVANNRAEDIRDRGRVELYSVGGKVVIPPTYKDRLLIQGGQILEYGEPDQLWLNDGKGRFTAASWTDGRFKDELGESLKSAPLDWGLTAAFRDLNHDGAPDLYVCNDFWTPDRIWMNDGKGNFQAIAPLAMRTMSGSSMGVDFADLDRNGDVDFLVVDMLSRDRRLRQRQAPAQKPEERHIGVFTDRPQILRNTLFRNRGDGTFAELARYSGLAASEWSWQPVFLDVDLDGYEDVLITAGHVKDVQDMDAEQRVQSRQGAWRRLTNPAERQKAFTEEMMAHMRIYPRLQSPVFAFRNSGEWTFSEQTQAWGTDQLGVHHGIATADLDNDGDLDFIVNSMDSGAGLYRNEAAAPRLAVRLKGKPGNRDGIGAKVFLHGGAVPMQWQEVMSGGKYLSGSDPLLVFAAGTNQTPMRLEVTWRGGTRSELENVRAGRLYEIAEPEAPGAVRPSQAPERTSPLFEDVSGQLDHVHTELPFDDFARQPLLPKRLSQPGPGVSWFDINGNGWDDLIIASGRGGRLTVMTNDQHGAFQSANTPPFNAPVTRDQTTALAFQTPNAKTILAGSSNYEDGVAGGPSARMYHVGSTRIDDSLPGQLSSTGPLALADQAGNGRLALFIGGRTIPGRYPEAASSLLLRDVEGTWQLDPEQSALLKELGLVNAAVWSDLDGDGFPELILAMEWGPIRVFQNAQGRLNDVTERMGFSERLGLWTSVATGDFDGDGRPDIIAGNWGLNSEYEQPNAENPIRLYHGNFAGAGTVELIEAERDRISGQFAPRQRLDLLATSMPGLLERFTSHQMFSEATIQEILQEQPARYLQVNSLATTVFLNRGNHFEARELPLDAQLAPVFGIAVADFDGNGTEDLFLAQNFFATRPEVPRMDTGRGLLLLNDGTGNFTPVSGQSAGIAVYGEQRGAAHADYDQDGRVDLVVTQNGAATRLFRNQAATPGLRVRLAGPPGNPDAIGAALRLHFSRTQGPVREIQAGSGYQSQNSTTQVLATPESPRQLWIRWPGGRETTTDLPDGLSEILVEEDGRLR